jgi:hypothetical protein
VTYRDCREAGFRRDRMPFTREANVGLCGDALRGRRLQQYCNQNRRSASHAVAFLLAAQYFFIRTPTAFFWAADIGLRRRRRGAATAAPATSLPLPRRLRSPGNAR